MRNLIALVTALGVFGCGVKTKPSYTPLSWLSTPPQQLTQTDTCKAVAFAVTGGGRLMRIQVDGVEGVLDTAVAKPITSPAGTRRIVTVRYVDPVSREETCHQLSFVCFDKTGALPTATLSYGELCSPPPGPQKGLDQTGPPRLVLVRPGRVMTRYMATSAGGLMVGTITLLAELRGQITEEWYCPGVEWEIGEVGDAVKSSHEADCLPYPEGLADQPRRFTKRITLPEGRFSVRVRLVKAGKVIAQDSAMVEIGSPTDLLRPW